VTKSWASKEEVRRIEALIARRRASVTIKAEQVANWFVQLNRTSRKLVGVPSAKSVNSLVRILNALREQTLVSGPQNPRSDRTLEFLRSLQEAFADLRKGLPFFIELLRRNEITNSTMIDRLCELQAAIERSLPYIGEPMMWPQPWHTQASSLVEPIERALKSAGRKTVSRTKPDGPLITVLCHAMQAIDGIDRTPEAVASMLKRRRKRGGKSS